MIILAEHKFDERGLVERAMRNLKCRRGQRNVVRWVLVSETFGTGSIVSCALCREFGLDPDEVIQ